MNKKLFLFVAATAALASCSDEMSFEQTDNIANLGGVKGKLVKTGLISSSNADATRGFTAQGNFVWMSNNLDGDLKVVDGKYPQIGLCWTGVNPAEPEFGAAAEAQANVFTNYLYEQVGWLQAGENALKYEECNPSKVYNAAFYNGYSTTPTAYMGGNYGNESTSTYRRVEYVSPAPTGATRYNGYFYGANTGKFKSPVTNSDKELNLGAGVFTTKNSSVFEGQYVVYFPYNSDFKKGPIIAKEPTNFVVDQKDDVYKQMDLNGYQLGVIDNYEGVNAGKNQQANFKTHNYSSFASIGLYTSNLETKKIQAVLLYSASCGIIYQAGIDASSVVANPADMTKVKQLDGYSKHIHAVYADLTNDNYSGTDPNGKNYITVGSDNNNNRNTAVKVVLPVLPQTVTDLQVIVIDEDYKSWVWQKGAEKTVEFKAGQTCYLDVDLKAEELKYNDYLAYDEPSLAAVISHLYHANSDKGVAGTIKLVRPIDLISKNDDKYPVSKTLAYKQNLTIEADAATNCKKDGCVPAQLVVKSETTRNIESENDDAVMTVKVPVIVEGLGCCANSVATLNIGGKDNTAVDQIKFTEKLTNYGTTNVGNTTDYTLVTLADVDNLRDTKYVKDFGYSKGSFERKDHPAHAAELNFLAPGITAGANLDANGEDQPQYTTVGNIINEGSILFKADGQFETGNYEGNRANWTTVASIKNTGWLINEKINNNKATVVTDIAGGDIVVDKYAYVTVTGTVTNENKWAYIHTVGSGYSTSWDGRLDVKTSTGSLNKGTIENHGVLNLLGGNLDNSEQGLLIDRLNGQVGGNKVNNGTKYTTVAKNDGNSRTTDGYNTIYFRGVEAAANEYKTDLYPGIYCTEVGTLARLSKVLTDVVQKGSCVVIDIVDGSSYDLKNFTEAQIQTLSEKDVRFSCDTELSCSNQNSSPKYCNYTRNNNDLCIGHCIDVHADVTLDKADFYRVVNNAIVRDEKTLMLTADAAQLQVGYNLYVYNYATVTSKDLAGTTVSTTGNIKVGNDMNVKANGSVYAAKKTDINVGHDVNNSGDVDAERILNVGNDVKNEGTVEVKKQFTIGNDYIGAYGSDLDSDGDNNVVKNDFKLSGNAEFAPNTTTDIKNTFYSLNTNSVFTREQLGTDTNSRSTVNCKHLDHDLQGHAVGGWPTEYVEF